MSDSLIDPFPSVTAALADAGRLDDEQLCDAVLSAEVAMRRAQAEMAALIAEVASRIEAMGYPISGASEELAAMLVISPRSADHRLGSAVGLCDRALVWSALFEGLIDAPKANLIVDLLAGVPDPLREQLELIALDYGQEHTGHQLRRKLIALTCEEDPGDVLRRQAVDRRGVWVSQSGHGMADIHGYLSAEHAEIFIQALDQLAGSPDCADPYEQGDQRTAEQRRADALVGFLAMHTVVEVNVDVVISADALVGDNAWTPESKRLGPIASQVARDLCLSPDARWRRLVTDPVTGELIAMGTTKYRIPAHLREAIKARDVTCRAPGCHHRAEFLDCDHIVAYPAGPTSADNLGGECRRHHRTKTFSAWQVSRDPHSSTHDLIWVSPLGRSYRTTSHRYKRDE